MLTAPNSAHLHLNSEPDTYKLAKKLAPELCKNWNHTSNVCIHLQGELGTGKTTFVRALLRSYGISENVKSPTYTLLETYQASNLHFYHIDFYRLQNRNNYINNEFRDLLQKNAIIFIEWPEHAENLLSPPDLLIHFTHTSHGRKATLFTYTTQGHSWLNVIAPKSKHVIKPGES